LITKVVLKEGRWTPGRTVPQAFLDLLEAQLGGKWTARSYKRFNDGVCWGFVWTEFKRVVG
jgi:hypothetical protein